MTSRTPPVGKVKMTFTFNVEPEFKRRLKAMAAHRDSFVQALVLEVLERELTIWEAERK